MTTISKQVEKNLSKITFGVLIQPRAALSVIVNDPVLLPQFSKFIVDLWKPEPVSQSDRRKKENITDEFPGLIRKWLSTSEISSTGSPPPQMTGEPQPQTQDIRSIIQEHIQKIEAQIIKNRQKMENEWWKQANPFITVFIEQTHNEGEMFQLAAKTASSVETSFGTWFEEVFQFFNPELHYVGAAGMDYTLGRTAYDVKSGPNILNKDGVERVKNKAQAIREVHTNPALSQYIKITDFKVAIAYGTRELAGAPMRGAEGNIIYAPTSWEVLTRDEFNAFLLYTEVIRYKINQTRAWTINDLDQAVLRFNQVYYNENPEKLRLLKAMDGYLSLKRLIESQNTPS